MRDAGALSLAMTRFLLSAEGQALLPSFGFRREPLRSYY